MLYKDVLKLLFPIELNGDFASDINIEGKHLDNAQASAEGLLREFFPDETYKLLPDWERVYGIRPRHDDTLQLRRNRIIAKIRERGGLSIPYFVSLASAIGYTITIDELMPFMAGIGRAGDILCKYECIWIWRVNVLGSSARFRATELENLFTELKPAHTHVYFVYL